MSKFYPLIARFLIAIIFLRAGILKIFNFDGTQHYMKMHGMRLTAIFLVVAILFEILGSLSIILGYKAKWGAVALIIFMIPVTLIFHTNFADHIQMTMFMKNLSMTGGLIYLATHGSGPLSIKR